MTLSAHDIDRDSVSVIMFQEVLWHSASYDGAWVRGVSAGGCGAPPKQGQWGELLRAARSILRHSW